MNAKCLKTTKPINLIEEKKPEKRTYFLLRLFSHHVQDQMLENNFQFLHQLSKKNF